PQIAVTEPVTPDSILGKDEMFEGDEGDSPKTQLALADAPASTEPTYQTESAAVSTESINTPQTELAAAVEPVENSRLTSEAEPTQQVAILTGKKDETLSEKEESESVNPLPFELPPDMPLLVPDAPILDTPQTELATAPHSTEKPETEQVAVAKPIVKPQEMALASEPVNAEPTYQAESAVVSTESINTTQTELATAVEAVET
uniref:hypothetical protein n=1 Tax=Treponema zioleckii TaxID=331680 RepID=UPI00168AC6CA